VSRPVVGVLHGPNLNRLGGREPEQYGRRTLEEIDRLLEGRAGELGLEIRSYQSNSEGDLVDRVQDWTPRVAGWLVNAGGLTHTSVVLRDALVDGGRPFVEVHLSNVFAREPFRRESLLSDVAVGVVSGFRARSYLLGLEGLWAHLDGETDGRPDG